MVTPFYCLYGITVIKKYVMRMYILYITYVIYKCPYMCVYICRYAHIYILPNEMKNGGGMLMGKYSESTDKE